MEVLNIVYLVPWMLFQSLPPHMAMESFLKFRFLLFVLVGYRWKISHSPSFSAAKWRCNRYWFKCRRAELTDKYGSSSSWQATIAPPVKGKMFKGLCVCYAVVLTTFFSVAISGYWAFGNQAKGTVLANFMVDEKALLPSWVLLMTNVFTLLQVSAVSLVSALIPIIYTTYVVGPASYIFWNEYVKWPKFRFTCNPQMKC